MDAKPADVVRAVICVATDDEGVLGAAWNYLIESSIGEAFQTALRDNRYFDHVVFAVLNRQKGTPTLNAFTRPW